MSYSPDVEVVALVAQFVPTYAHARAVVIALHEAGLLLPEARPPEWGWRYRELHSWQPAVSQEAARLIARKKADEHSAGAPTVVGYRVVGPWVEVLEWLTNWPADGGGS